jgi:hypothetical protein
MMELKIRDELIIIDEDKLPFVAANRWIVQVGRSGNKYLKCTTVEFKNKYLHRILIAAPVGSFVDHINGNTLDNRTENLRICSKKQNNFAKHRTPGSKYSKYKGVVFKPERNAWSAQIGFDGRYIKSGYFRTPEEAAKEYDRLAVEKYGEFAVTNKMLGKFET